MWISVFLAGCLVALSGADDMTTTTSSPFEDADLFDAITPAPADYDSSGMRYDYGEALGKSILFYDAQRTGELPENNPIPWRGDSVLYDADGDYDLTGGWFDAGDHIKFNFPMSYSVWVLNWGFLRFADAYKATGQTNMMCDMIKWPLEYFLKCWRPDEEILYTQIGDVQLDHNRWASPETLNISRPAEQSNATCPGSDVAGDMASALASGYLVFTDLCNDTDFADSLLEAAKSLYKFGMDYRGVHSDCLEQAYTSSNYRDEMSAAGAWMYLVTDEASYLEDAEQFYDNWTPWALDWDGKAPGANLLLFEATQDDTYKRATQAFVTQAMPGGDIPYTPCGLVYRNEWGVNRHAANEAFIALMAADYGINSEEYTEWGLSQINYILGDNNYNISYMVGFGDYYPTHVHHRGSSCLVDEDCDINYSGPNPNLLVGALAGGPDEEDGYEDERNDYVRNEVALDYNAGFQSSLAALVHFANDDMLPEAPPRVC